MDVSDLELRGVKLPERETFLGDLTAQQIVEKIEDFHRRLKKENHLSVAPFAETYFLNLIALYPVSMCSRTMTDTLKLVAAIFYFGSKSSTEEKTTEEEPKIKELFPQIKSYPFHNGYSFEDLSLIFDRTRTAIVESIKQKGKEAQIILEEASLRASKKASIEVLTEEEKKVLVQKKNEEDSPKSLPFRNS